jgi:hypothetical protein
MPAKKSKGYKEYKHLFNKKGIFKPKTFPGSGDMSEINRIRRQAEFDDFETMIDSTPVNKTPFFSDDIDEDEDEELSPENKNSIEDPNGSLIPVSFQGNTTRSINDVNTNIESTRVTKKNPYSRGGKSRRKKSRKSKRRRIISRRR